MPYKILQDTFDKAFLQASKGKGKERHANNEPFDEQPILWIEEKFNSFQLGQAVKKIYESQRLPTERAVNELYGAMVYLAARVLYLRKLEE